MAHCRHFDSKLIYYRGTDRAMRYVSKFVLRSTRYGS